MQELRKHSWQFNLSNWRDWFGLGSGRDCAFCEVESFSGTEWNSWTTGYDKSSDFSVALCPREVYSQLEDRKKIVLWTLPQILRGKPWTWEQVLALGTPKSVFSIFQFSLLERVFLQESATYVNPHSLTNTLRLQLPLRLFTWVGTCNVHVSVQRQGVGIDTPDMVSSLTTGADVRSSTWIMSDLLVWR